MPKRTHNGAHLYERIETKRGKTIYMCMIPSCPHFISVPETIVNRVSKCWGDCGRELVMTKEIYSSKIRKPFCEECKNERREAREALMSLSVKEE